MALLVDALQYGDVAGDALPALQANGGGRAQRGPRERRGSDASGARAKRQ